MSSSPGSLRVGVLYSRVRVEEKLLFEAFEKRGVSLDLLDDQKLIFDITDVNKPKQVCHDETVTQTAPPKDEHRIAGTAIGAVVGGLVGNQVGGGKGKTLATAVGGGYAGNRIQANRQHAQVSSSVERKCETVNNTSTKIVGYDVRYEYNGVTRTVRMDHDPGDRVQVQEGVTAVSDAH